MKAVSLIFSFLFAISLFNTPSDKDVLILDNSSAITEFEQYQTAFTGQRPYKHLMTYLTVLEELGPELQDYNPMNIIYYNIDDSSLESAGLIPYIPKIETSLDWVNKVFNAFLWTINSTIKVINVLLIPIEMIYDSISTTMYFVSIIWKIGSFS